jgi:putative membrane protein
MVDYDPKGWVSIVFQLRGSVLVTLWPRICFVAATGACAAYLFEHYGFKIPPITHTMVGVALGLLLVFRTNASFDRWWEGRKQLGALVNRSRDLVRQVASYVEGDDARTTEARVNVRRLVCAFYGLLRQHLRAERDLAALGSLLSQADRADLEPVKNRPVVMASWITAELVSLARQGKLTEDRLRAMDGNLTAFHDCLGACERILRTPVPFAYAQHIKSFLLLFTFSAPFAIVEAMRWYTPIAAGVLAYAMFGIEEIGVEIEDPFGYDPNDLPLDTIGSGIELTTAEILNMGTSITRRDR